MYNFDSGAELTFLLPIRIDSGHRLRNFSMVFPYLVHVCPKATFRISEAKSVSSGAIAAVVKAQRELGANIIHRVEDYPPQELFHRTRYLNEMLLATTTKYVSNYDIDVLLPDWIYSHACAMLEDGADVVYPYGYGDWDQHMVDDATERMSEFLTKLSCTVFRKFRAWTTWTGHAIFFRTASYIDMGGECELYCCYGPEDRERCLRAHRTGLNVKYLPGAAVYHLEHERNTDSGYGDTRPLQYALAELFNVLHDLSPSDYSDYIAIVREQLARRRRYCERSGLL